MRKVLSSSSFSLLEIDKEFQDGFKCAKGNLSDFHCNALLWIAQAIRKPSASDFVWCDNNAWWDDENRRYSVYVTENGIAMLKDWTRGRLYRIKFR